MHTNTSTSLVLFLFALALYFFCKNKSSSIVQKSICKLFTSGNQTSFVHNIIVSNVCKMFFSGVHITAEYFQFINDSLMLSFDFASAGVKEYSIPPENTLRGFVILCDQPEPNNLRIFNQHNRAFKYYRRYSELTLIDSI